MFTLPCSSETFDDAFPTVTHCLDYLRKASWGTYEYLCPRCGWMLGYPIEKRSVIQCANQSCRYQASLTSGTIFHNTKLCIRSWFKAIVYFCEQRDVSVRNFALLNGLSYKTAWLVLTKLKIAYEQCREEESTFVPGKDDEYDPESQNESQSEKIIDEDGTEEMIFYYDNVEEMEFRHERGRIRFVPRRKQKRNIASQFYFYVFCCLSVPPLAVIRYLYSQQDPLERYSNRSPCFNYLH